MKKMFASLVVGAALGVVFVTGGTDAHASEVDGVWTPRTVEQIKADINKAKDNKYTIVWGDTLSGISQATNITVQKLADMNKIANVDLIYAGNTLVFEGNVVTAKNDKGETVAQSVVTPQDKNDANKPVGKQAEEKAQGTTASSQSQNKQGTTMTSGKTATSSQGTSAAVTGTNGSQTGTSGSVEGTTSSTAGTTTSSGTVETPAQPSEPATPSQPTQPSKPAEKPSTGGEQGGATTPTTPDTTPINMGNSGKVFDSEEAASEYGYAEIANENSPWYGYRFGASQLVNKDYELLGTWTVDFREYGSASTNYVE
ncbi:LysM domain-containing protein [Enterococcus avium]|uniref:LysM peptidoglycan-binding domain-containing protein n=1 Tax=Enterococcus avium TaxID=33945 RepID=UPI00288E98D0|nr:LysM domain-containing protein [Enterococcus avium]MDT2486315.1 LysM domain-containing protein [Enterococcus avium]MDT2517464.1 LysM domain-containing protein [Enterococcus avium]